MVSYSPLRCNPSPSVFQCVVVDKNVQSGSLEKGLFSPIYLSLVLLQFPTSLTSSSVGAAHPPLSPQLPPQLVSNVVHHVGVHWYDFALHLGMSSTVLDVISFEKQGLTNDCCRESLQRWLRHDRDTGEKEREVGVVLESVMKMCGPATVERIRSGWQSKGVRHASPTSLLLSTPELADLREFVVPFAAAQWEAVADYLQVSYEKRSAIAASERGNVEVCCRELFNQWLQQLPGTGSLPRTWEVVLDMVWEAVGTEIAKQIRTKLDSKYGGEESSSLPEHVHGL